MDLESDLAFALEIADIADAITLRSWRPEGVSSTSKADGSPVTTADRAVEEAVLAVIRERRQGDGLLGEEVGEHRGTNGRRWIVDGIDGTRSFAAGEVGWGTLIALEIDNDIAVGVATSPVQDRRWWAERGRGAFQGSARRRSLGTQIRVAGPRPRAVDHVVSMPGAHALPDRDREAIETLAGGVPPIRGWHHALRVAEGEVDVSVWFFGEVWDLAAPSVIVEEAGGKFSDRHGRRRLDTTSAVFSNGTRHADALAALA